MLPSNITVALACEAVTLALDMNETLKIEEGLGRLLWFHGYNAVARRRAKTADARGRWELRYRETRELCLAFGTTSVKVLDARLRAALKAGVSAASAQWKRGGV